jgi:hypothetical protein
MSLTKIFQLYAIKSGSTVLHQLQDATLSRNVMEQLETPTGGTKPLFTAELGSKPDISGTSGQLKSFLTLMGLSGADTGILKLLGRKLVNATGPVAIGTSAHASWTAAKSMGFISTITAGNKQRANLQYKFQLLYDGTNPIIVYAGTATLDNFTAAAEQYILGPISIEGTVIEGTNDLSINLNPAEMDSADDFQADPVFHAIQKTEPTIEFSTTDPGIWALDGTEITAAKVNLLGLEPNQKRYGDAETKHILFDATSGQIRCQSVGGTKQLTKVFIRCISPDNTDPSLSATVDSAVDVS